MGTSVPGDFPWKPLGNEPCSPYRARALPEVSPGAPWGLSLPRDKQGLTHLSDLLTQPPQQQHHHVHSGSPHFSLGVCLGYGRHTAGDLWGQGRGHHQGPRDAGDPIGAATDALAVSQQRGRDPHALLGAGSEQLPPGPGGTWKPQEAV